MFRDVTFTTAITVIVGALVTLAIVAALIYLATVGSDHDAKLALIAMVSGASAGTGTALVVLNRPRPADAVPPPTA